MYLNLFNRCVSSTEECDVWIVQGPIFRCKGVQVTDGQHIKMYDDFNESLNELFITNGKIYYAGIWYGDFFVCSEISPSYIAREYDEKQAIPTKVTPEVGK